jgi:hypothetical protein
MSNTKPLTVLNTLASQILACDTRTYGGQCAQEKILRENPLVGFALVTYSYTQEYGSDGCWDRTEKSVCLLREWVSGAFQNKHTGNRSYNFTVTDIDGDLTAAEQRKAKHDTYNAQVEERSRIAREAIKAKAEQRMAEVALAKQIFPNGCGVSHNGKVGTVEALCRSSYKPEQIVVKVKFHDGSKWLDRSKIVKV